jgi:hypothetical protein
MNRQVCTIFCLFLTAGLCLSNLVAQSNPVAQEATIGDIRITFDYQQGIRLNVYNLTVKGMKNKQIHFGFGIAQAGQWLENTWVELKPETVLYDPANWRDSACWFSYTYELLQNKGKPAEAYWGSFFIMDTAKNQVLARKDISFSLPGSVSGNGNESENEDTALYPVTIKDDFSVDRLGDITRYAQFGPSYFKVSNGVLRGEWQEPRLEFMNQISIFPCFGKNSSITFDLRWAGGDGANLLVATDYLYRMVGRRTHVYFNLNEQRLVVWNSEGVDTKELKVRKNEWLHVQIDRLENRIVVFVNNNKMLEKKLDKPDAIHNESQEVGYGGYAFETDIRTYTQVVEIDNLVIKGEKSPVQFKALSEKFYVNKAVDPLPYRFTVIYEEGFETWAEGQVAVSIPYIKAIANVLGVPTMSHSLGMVQNRGEYFTKSFAGYNNRGVVLQAANLQYPQALSTHELAHNWYNYYGKKWSIEGSADFCPFAYLETTKQRLMLATDFLFNSENIEKSAMLNAVKNYYLEDEESTKDFFKGGLPDFNLIHKMAWKQRVFVYTLYRLLGPQGFRQLHKEALPLSHGMSSKEIQSFAEQIAGRDLSDLFDGWVFPGQSTLPPEELFKDDDKDGLSNFDEKLFGTDSSTADTDNDGYGDRGEIAYGSNPLSAQSPNGKPIIIDGFFEDWNNLKNMVQDAQDAKGGEDMKSVQFLFDLRNQVLLGRIEFWRAAAVTPDPSNNNFYFTLDIDTNMDTIADYRINLFFNKPNVSNAFKTNGYASEKWDPSKWTGLSTDGVEYAYRETGLELQIPLSIINLPGSCAIYMNSGTPAGTDWFDKAPVVVNGETNFPLKPSQIWQPGK